MECVFVGGFCLYPANAGWGLWCECLCAGSPFPRQSWLGFLVYVFVCGLSLYPTNPGWGLLCVCLCAGFAFTPPILAVVCGVCVCVLALPLTRQSWLGFVVCVYVCEGCLYPANPGWGLWLACLCPAFPRLGWGLGLFWRARGWCRARCVLLWCCAAPGLRVCGTRWPLLPGIWSCAVVVAGGVPLWRALWPRVCAPRLVRSDRSRCTNRLSRCRGAVTARFIATHLVRCSPRLRVCGCAGHVEASREPGCWCVPACPCGPGLAPCCTPSRPLCGVVPGSSLRRQSWAAWATVVLRV